MKFEKIHNKGQAKLFKNQYLEYLTKTHPLVIWGIYIPIIGFMLYYSNVVANMDWMHVGLSFFSGMFFWTLFEYTIHRFAFHFIAESERALKIVYIIHGNHHEYPRDKERLFMPPVPSLILASCIFGSMYFIAQLVGLKENVFAFFPGFMFGYLMYGTMHYAIHAWNPPYKWMKPLWRNHHLHHYKNERRGFGVSTTLWEPGFGNYVRPYERKRRQGENTGFNVYYTPGKERNSILITIFSSSEKRSFPFLNCCRVFIFCNCRSISKAPIIFPASSPGLSFNTFFNRVSFTSTR